MHSWLLILFLILIVLAALPKTTESHSDRPITPSSTTATTMASPTPLSPDDAALVESPLPELPVLPITSQETLRACRAMNVSPRDIFVCSYPKSGTTWTQNIVVRLLWEIAHGEKSGQDTDATATDCPLPEDWHLSHSAPFYEPDRYWRKQEHPNDEPMERRPAQTPILGAEGEYRVFNTHLLPHQLPKGAKCVYVLRDPLDVMVSFYHHLSNQSVEDGGFTGSFQEFFEGFLEGTIVYGKWQNHIEAWLGAKSKDIDHEKNENPFLILHYEEMKDDLARETKRLARFLLESESGETPEDQYLDAIVSKVVPQCTFASMKRDRKQYTPKTVSWKTDPQTGKPFEFVRKGMVGDGRKFLLETPSVATLRDRWIHRDALTARARWTKASVPQEIVDRYL